MPANRCISKPFCCVQSLALLLTPSAVTTTPWANNKHSLSPSHLPPLVCRILIRAGLLIFRRQRGARFFQCLGHRRAGADGQQLVNDGQPLVNLLDRHAPPGGGAVKVLVAGLQVVAL